MTVAIYVIVIALSPTPSLLILRKNLEKGEQAREAALTILSLHTGLTEDWVVLSLCGVGTIIDGVVPIVYGVFIPEPTRIKNSDTKWMKINEVVDPSLKEMVDFVIWRKPC